MSQYYIELLALHLFHGNIVLPRNPMLFILKMRNWNVVLSPMRNWTLFIANKKFMVTSKVRKEQIINEERKQGKNWSGNCCNTFRENSIAYTFICLVCFTKPDECNLV